MINIQGYEIVEGRIYVTKGLEGWLRKPAEEWLSTRPHWFW